MSEENKALVRRFVEVFNQGNLSAIDEIIAPNYVRYDPASPDGIRGSEGIKQFVTTYRTAIPDIHITTEEQIAEGDKVVTRWTGHGTHKAALMGIPPTGKQATVTGITITHIANGKIVEEWINWDTLGMLQQLGVVPPPGSSGG